jgi:hypothetical protein
MNVLAILVLLAGFGLPTVRGTVSDAESGTPLVGATVQVKGTWSGTMVNTEGHFQLDVVAFPAELEIRHIGYRTVIVLLEAQPEQRLIIRMEPSSIEMPVLEITGEDPAIGIMRRVIVRKQETRKDLETWIGDAYNRFRMENDTGIVSIWESFTRAHWDRSRGFREVSVWQDRTANTDVADVLPAAMLVVNLYDDNVEVAGHTLMGVTHPDALDHYTFRLDSLRAMDSSVVYDIMVEPRRRTVSGFVGRISVLEEEWAMISVELRPGRAFLFPPPVDRFDITYRQQYSRFGGRHWLPVGLVSEADIDIALGPLLTFPTFRVRQLSQLSGFQINVPLPDSLYESDQRVVVDSISAGRLRPADMARVPLTEREQLAYATIDSTLTMEKAFEPGGLLGRLARVDSEAGPSGTETSGRSLPGVLGAVRLRPEFWVNRVEGGHVGLWTYVGIPGGVDVGGRLAYSQESTSWSGSLFAQRSGPVGVRVQWDRGVAIRNPGRLRGALFNSVSVVAGTSDYFDYVHLDGVTMELTMDVRDWRLSSAFRSHIHDSVSQRVRQTFIGRNLPLLPNLSVPRERLQSVSFGLDRTWEYAPRAIGPQRRVSVVVEQGVNVRFTRVDGELLWRIPTFLRRRLLPPAFDVRLAAGLADNQVPLVRLGLVDGSGTFSSFGGLRTRPDRPYEGSRYALFAWEHTFRTLPFEWLGWNAPVRRHLNVIVHGAHGTAWLPRGHPAEDRASRGVHQELGLSLSGLFTVVRLDATWRLDKQDFVPGLSISRIF